MSPTTVEYLVASIGCAFSVGIGVYAIISYAVAARFSDARPFSSAVGQMVRESLLAFLVQPLIPFYFFFGRKMGGRKDGTPVVFVHGYFQNRADFIWLARILRKRGFGPLYGVNYWSFGPIEDSALAVAKFAEDVRVAHGVAAVDLVCHSLGGLVAAAVVRHHPKLVRKCVTIASPHAGIAWPGPLLGRVGRQMRAKGAFLTERAATRWEVPLLSVYSSHDNIVYPWRTSSRADFGGRDVLLEGPGHFAILFDPRMATAVVDFLREP
ncbi:alpha/beta fold hydrolase [soil metagenome]